jgi:hypothetical protein
VGSFARGTPARMARDGMRRRGPHQSNICQLGGFALVAGREKPPGHRTVWLTSLVQLPGDRLLIAPLGERPTSQRVTRGVGRICSRPSIRLGCTRYARSSSATVAWRVLVGPHGCPRAPICRTRSVAKTPSRFKLTRRRERPKGLDDAKGDQDGRHKKAAKHKGMDDPGGNARRRSVR